MAAMSKSDVLQQLKQRVLSMQLAPGQPLDETALSLEYGISRTPLREILQRLGGEGYLRLEQNRGAHVTSMDMATLRHFFQAAPMIYASVARLAAEQANSQQVRELKSVQSDFRKSIKEGSSSQTAMHNHSFHVLIGQMAASPYLLPSLDRLLIDHTRIGHMFYRSGSKHDAQRIEMAASQHDDMIEAIEAHRPAEAVDLTLKHWDLSRHQMEQFVSPDPLPFNLHPVKMTKENARAV